MVGIGAGVDEEKDRLLELVWKSQCCVYLGSPYANIICVYLCDCAGGVVLLLVILLPLESSFLTPFALVPFGCYLFYATPPSLCGQFVALATSVCDALQEHGFWADYTDPASGFPGRSERCAWMYPDVLAAQALLKYPIVSADCCKLLLHPAFGTKVE